MIFGIWERGWGSPQMITVLVWEGKGGESGHVHMITIFWPSWRITGRAQEQGWTNRESFRTSLQIRFHCYENNHHK